MKWWWTKREPRWPEPPDAPTIEDLARSARDVEDSKARLARVVARDDRVDHQEQALRREQKVNHLGPTIARALRAKGTT